MTSLFVRNRNITYHISGRSLCHNRSFRRSLPWRLTIVSSAASSMSTPDGATYSADCRCSRTAAADRICAGRRAPAAAAAAAEAASAEASVSRRRVMRHCFTPPTRRRADTPPSAAWTSPTCRAPAEAAAAAAWSASRIRRYTERRWLVTPTEAAAAA